MRRRRSRIVVVALLCAVLVIGACGYVAVQVAIVGRCLEEYLPLPQLESRLTTRPYVQDVTRTSAALLWWSPEATAAIVRYGVAPALTEAIEVAAARRHEVVLTDLQPATVYAYEVVTGHEVAAGAFRTAPDEAATVTIGVIGDGGDGRDAQRAVARRLAGFEPDLVLYTGDVVYPHGARCRYDDRFFAPYQDLIGSVPFYPAVGNHDLAPEGDLAYFDVFRLPTATPEGGERFYAFDHGPVRFVVLDGEAIQPDADDPDLAARQRAWLEADLAANHDRLPWTIAVLHRPAFTSAEHETGAEAVREAIVPLLTAGGVDLVLSGHVHAYERSVPIDGVTYVVTGGAGGRLHDVVAGGEIAVAASVHHAVRLTISPAELTGEAIAADGSVVDRFTLVPASP